MLVRRPRSDSKWETLLLDDPSFTMNEDYTGFVATRHLIAADEDLIPLTDREADAAMMTLRTIALLPRHQQEKVASPV